MSISQAWIDSTAVATSWLGAGGAPPSDAWRGHRQNCRWLLVVALGLRLGLRMLSLHDGTASQSLETPRHPT
ncbi:MAG: hypothetical protein DWQ36_20595 [Acidobacteria bacterium]|nr:MAG: hypothetical protein DWQ30_21020 [Acidobacteriota bacterium]REK03270.1 MAG: hypothetical protein DWQ36_20595 [Acidobacteriota bacterium]